MHELANFAFEKIKALWFQWFRYFIFVFKLRQLSGAAIHITTKRHLLYIFAENFFFDTVVQIILFR